MSLLSMIHVCQTLINMSMMPVKGMGQRPRARETTGTMARISARGISRSSIIIITSTRAVNRMGQGLKAGSQAACTDGEGNNRDMRSRETTETCLIIHSDGESTQGPGPSAEADDPTGAHNAPSANAHGTLPPDHSKHTAGYSANVDGVATHGNQGAGRVHAPPPPQTQTQYKPASEAAEA